MFVVIRPIPVPKAPEERHICVAPPELTVFLLTLCYKHFAPNGAETVHMLLNLERMGLAPDLRLENGHHYNFWVKLPHK